MSAPLMMYDLMPYDEVAAATADVEVEIQDLMSGLEGTTALDARREYLRHLRAARTAVRQVAERDGYVL